MQIPEMFKFMNMLNIVLRIRGFHAFILNKQSISEQNYRMWQCGLKEFKELMAPPKELWLIQSN